MVSRSETDLLDIRSEYKRMYGKSLYHDISVWPCCRQTGLPFGIPVTCGTSLLRVAVCLASVLCVGILFMDFRLAHPVAPKLLRAGGS